MNNGTSGKAIVFPEAKLNNNGNTRMSLVVGYIPPTIEQSVNTEDVFVKKVEEKGSKTVVISNSTNLMATDIIFSGVYFYYKWPIDKVVSKVRNNTTKIEVKSYSSDGFLYLEDDVPVEILYEDGSFEEVSPVKIFLNEAHKRDNRFYSDNKTYQIKKYYNLLKITFSKRLLRLESNGKIVKLKSFGNIIHIDSFVSSSGSKFIESNTLVSTILDTSKLRYTSSELLDYTNLISEADTSPFIYPESVFQILDNTVYLEIFAENNSIKRKEYDLDQKIIYSDYSGVLDPITTVKVIPNGGIYYPIPVEEKVDDTRLCGQKRLERVDGENFLLWQDNTMITGVRDDQIVQFIIPEDELLEYDNLLLSVVDAEGNEVDSILLENTIITKSATPVGVKYKDRRPGVLV